MTQEIGLKETSGDENTSHTMKGAIERRNAATQKRLLLDSSTCTVDKKQKWDVVILVGKAGGAWERKERRREEQKGHRPRIEPAAKSTKPKREFRDRIHLTNPPAQKKIQKNK